jgi:hypothetical protein
MKSRLEAEANGITRNSSQQHHTIVAIGTFPALEQDGWILAKPLTRCSQRLHT